MVTVHPANEKLFDDFVAFYQIQMANRDMDPVYPVLRRIGESVRWTPEEMVRAVFLHVAYYDLGSALAALERRDGAFLRAFTDPVPGLKCGTERRRHRMGENLSEHLTHLHQIAGVHDGLKTWIDSLCDEGDDPRDNWMRVSEDLMRVRGNGRWAAFKTCEMLAEVCGMPLKAPDMGHANSSGPRHGLGLLYTEARVQGNTRDVIKMLDRISGMLVKELTVECQGADITLETAETALCDFYSMAGGKYYPGLDIDIMQEQLTRASVLLGPGSDLIDAAFLARGETLPEAYLGETRGWQGPDTERKRMYRVTGKIPERE